MNLGAAGRLTLMSATILVSTLGALPIVPPAIHQGASCVLGPYRSVQIGAVLPSTAEPDRAGPSGNEVNNVYRVFFITTNRPQPVSGFAGWLSTSFDRRLAFTPAGLVTPTGVPMSVTARADDPTHLELNSWMRVLASHHSVFDQSLQILLADENVQTVVSPCFASPWQGEPTSK